MNFRGISIGLAVIALASAGCGVKPQTKEEKQLQQKQTELKQTERVVKEPDSGVKQTREVTELQRKEAAHLVSEADFAVMLRDYPRAEALFAQAAELSPDRPEYWVSLGTARVRLGNRNGARDAYQRALKAYEEQVKSDENNPDPWLQQAYVLALLGRADEGRALLETVAKRFPDNRTVRNFIEAKQFDRILADPTFKEVAL